MSNRHHIGISLGNLTEFRDGIGEFSYQLCSRLAKSAARLRDEHQVELWFHAKTCLHGAFGSQVKYLRTQPHHEFFHRQSSPFVVWHTLSQLNRYLPPLGTLHRISTVHDLNFAYFKNRFSQWRDARRLQRLLARTDQLFTISKFVHGDLQARTGWLGPSQVIYNGARDLSGSTQVPVDGVKPNEFLFHLSRMSRSKNVVSLLNLARAWPDQAIVLAGPSGTDQEEVKRQVATSGLKHVTVIANITDEQKAWLYANCRAFLFPSLTEGFGLPPIEAMYFGKPVFLAALTSLPEVGGDAAHYWTDFDGQAMRRTVEKALATWSAHEADSARRHAQQYTWDLCAESHIDAYLKALNTLRVNNHTVT
jgi:glycosyltransferase involved in cell wall biosynthesis